MEWGINLKSKSKSLHAKIWSYLILFSIVILASLWLVQVIFLNRYYEWSKTMEMSHIADRIVSSYNSEDAVSVLDQISYERGVCVEIVTTDETSYSSNGIDRGCTLNEKNNIETVLYKRKFIRSGEKRVQYIYTNPIFHNKTILYGVKLESDTYAFIMASLEPLGATTSILASQLVYVTIGVLLLSFVIAYFISKNISKPIVQMSRSAKRMGNGNLNVHFDTNSSIEEINELAVTLNKMNAELVKTDELRRDLMANVSHDLKTPLTMIKAYAEMIRDLDQQKEKKDAHLNVIIEEADRLNVLVNDILNLSKLQSNIEELNMEEFDLTECINTILKRYDILREKEGYQFIFKQTKPLMIQADRAKMEQVIYNLINNAINYTGKDNKVTIKVKESKDSIRVQIIDTGKGIKEEDLDVIWDRYYKSSKKHKRNAFGTGLGLSIVKNVLEHHHFNYGVTSKINKGTTFFFDVPKQPSKPKKTHTKPTKKEKSND